MADTAPVDPALQMVLAYMQVQAAEGTVPTRTQFPGTVVSYIAATGVATVNVDDGATIPMTSLVGPVEPDDRVMVAYEKPRGVFVVGVIGDARSSSGGTDGCGDGGLCLRGYCTPGVGVDCTDGIRDAIADALAEGYSHIKPEFAIVPYEISDRIDLGAMELRGFGDQTTTFLCTTEDAGIWHGDNLAGYESSWSCGFYIDAGDVAKQPWGVGVKVGGIFRNISVRHTVETGDWEDNATGWLLGTQNCVFEEILLQNGLTVLRLDGGAATNKFLRCEINLPAHTMIDFCSINLTSGLFPYCGWNTFDTCILEYNTDAATRMIRHRSGVLNLFTDCVVYITGGDTSDMDVCVESVDTYSIGVSTLRLRGCTIGCTPNSSTKVAVKATWPATVYVEDGNTFDGWDYAIQGYCRISGQQHFQSITTLAIDETTDFPFTPAEDVSWQVTFTRPTGAHPTIVNLVAGETFARWYMTTEGAMAWGDGTANPTQLLFRSDATTLRVTCGFGTDGLLAASYGGANQVALGDLFGAPSVVFGGAFDTVAFRAGAGIVGVGKLSVSNAAAATVPGAVVSKVEVFDAAGASLGFVAVYSSIV